jgi:ADP-heptose:LPS heptosyltransferase
MLKKIEKFFRGVFLNILLLLFHKSTIETNGTFSSDSKILFIRLNKIGDALVTTPLLNEVKKKLGCKVYVLADRKNYFIFENNPSVDEIKIFNKGFKGIFDVRKFIKQNNIDTLVDLHDDVSTTVSFIIALSGVQNTLGLKKSNYKIYTDTIDRLNTASHHIIDRLLQLSKLFNIKVNHSEASVIYYTAMDSTEQARKWIHKLNSDNKFLLGINISAGSEARFWGVTNFRQLVALIEEYNLVYILFSTPQDYDLAKQIVNEKFIYPPSKDFNDFAAAILELNMLFTPDTSVIHIASINKIPVFGVYVKYNTRDMIWSPYNTEFDCVITEEPTLKNVTFDEVKKKFIPFLEQTLNV